MQIKKKIRLLKDFGETINTVPFTSFSSGAIRDTQDGKEDYTETISWCAFKRYAQYMTKMAAKYGSGNFKKGIPIDNYEKSLLRHVQKYMENKYEGGTVEVEQDHLSAIVFNVFGIMHEEGRIIPNKEIDKQNKQE